MELLELVRKLLLAKFDEESKRKERIEIEEQIAALVPGPEKGQKSAKVDGYTVTVERGFNYKADCAAIEEAMSGNGLSVPLKTKTTRELDEKGYEWYRNNMGDVFDNILSKHVIVTSKKTSVSIKEAKK